MADNTPYFATSWASPTGVHDDVPGASSGLLDWLGRSGTPWPGPQAAGASGGGGNSAIPGAVASGEEDWSPDRRLRAERVRGGPQGVVIPWFLPYFDEQQTLYETASMRLAYRKMMADPNVKAALLGKILAVAALDLKVMPAQKKDRQSAEDAEFVRWNLEEGLEGGVPGLVWSILSGALIDGYSVCEKVWARETRGEHRGKYYLRAVKPKDTGRDVILETDDYRNVVAVKGMRYNPGVRYSPADFIIYRHLPLFDTATGTSDLRAVYSRFWFLDSVLKLRAVAAEKRALPIVVGHYQAASDRPALEDALRLVRSQNWLAVPESVKVDVVSIAGSADSTFSEIVKDCKHDIFLGIAGAMLQSLEGSIPGGRGSSAEHRDTADLFVWHLSKAIEALLNDHHRGVVRDIVDLNRTVIKYPKAVLASVSVQDQLASLEVSKVLFEMGVKQNLDEIYELAARQPPDPDDPTTGLGGKVDQDAQLAASTLMAKTSDGRPNAASPGVRGAMDDRVHDDVRPGQVPQVPQAIGQAHSLAQALPDGPVAGSKMDEGDDGSEEPGLARKVYDATVGPVVRAVTGVPQPSRNYLKPLPEGSAARTAARDESGKPEKLYFGSRRDFGGPLGVPEAPFGVGRDSGTNEAGIFLTQHRGVAEGYARDPSNVLEAAVDVRRPLDVTKRPGDDELRAIMSEYARHPELAENLQKLRRLSQEKEYEPFHWFNAVTGGSVPAKVLRKAMKRLGYDAVRHLDYDVPVPHPDGSTRYATNWLLFDPARIYAHPRRAPRAKMAEPGERNFAKAQTDSQAASYQRQADAEAGGDTTPPIAPPTPPSGGSSELAQPLDHEPVGEPVPQEQPSAIRPRHVLRHRHDDWHKPPTAKDYEWEAGNISDTLLQRYLDSESDGVFFEVDGELPDGLDLDDPEHQSMFDDRLYDRARSMADDPDNINAEYVNQTLDAMPASFGRNKDFAALASAIKEDPHNLVAQLAMNDWLEENGHDHLKFYFDDDEDHPRARPFDELVEDSTTNGVVADSMGRQQVILAGKHVATPPNQTEPSAEIDNFTKQVPGKKPKKPVSLNRLDEEGEKARAVEQPAEQTTPPPDAQPEPQPQEQPQQPPATVVVVQKPEPPAPPAPPPRLAVYSCPLCDGGLALDGDALRGVVYREHCKCQDCGGTFDRTLGKLLTREGPPLGCCAELPGLNPKSPA